MVQSISGAAHSNPLTSVATRLGAATDVAPTDTSKSAKPLTLLQTLGTSEDSAQYQANSLDRALNEQDALKFGRQAQRLSEPYNSQRVAELKAKLSTPSGVANYLNQVDWSSVANKVLEAAPGITHA